MDGGLHFSRALAPPSPLASSIARPPVRARQPAGRESFDAASRATLGSLALQRLQPLLPCCRPRSTQHTRQPFQPAAIVALASTLPPLLGLLNLPEALGKASSFIGTYSLLPYSIYLGNNHPIGLIKIILTISAKCLEASGGAWQRCRAKQGQIKHSEHERESKCIPISTLSTLD